MANRIRVLLVAPSLDILGGQAVQATRLLENLRREPDVAIDFQPINPRFPAPLKWVKKIPCLRTLLTFVLYCTQLTTRAWRYDILHVFSAGLSSYTLWTIPALLIGRLYRKNFILNYRDGQVEQHLREWRSALPTVRLADVIISPSEYVVKVFGEFGVRAQAIFNVIDLNGFRYRQRSKLRPVFMTNRILEPLYNVGCVLRAFAIVQQRYPDASLTVAHDGVCRPELERLARELNLMNTRFVGSVPHGEIPELYDAADVYLTSPNFDCLPGSLLECYATGLPIIATRTGGIPYILEDGGTGLLVECDDHQAMAACALRLLEDAELVERLTKRGFRELEKYHWERGAIREKWLAVYRTTMDARAETH
jgi:glycosyltransferase involved in cell wall biosynthesis